MTPRETRRGRAPLAAAGAIAFAVIFGVAWLARSTDGGETGEVEHDPAPAKAPADVSPNAMLVDTPPPVETAPQSSGEREEIPTTELSVEVTDVRGQAIDGALLVATGPNDEKETKHGASAAWENLAPGLWSVEASCSGFLPTESRVRLKLGDRRAIVIELRTREALSGTLRNRFGTPYPWPVWVLKDDETHPRLPDDAEALLTERADREGYFSIKVPKPGPYRVSVGPIGRSYTRSNEPVWLDPVQPREAEIVLPGGALVELRLEGLDPEDKRRVEAVLFSKAEDRSEEDGGDRRLKRDRARLEELRADLADPTLSDARRQVTEARILRSEQKLARDAERNAKKKERPDRWRSHRDYAVPASGAVDAPHVRPDVEYRLVLRVGSDSFVSASSFTPDTDSILTIHATVPASSGVEDDRSRGPGILRHPTFEIGVAKRPLPPDAPPPGVHWK